MGLCVYVCAHVGVCGMCVCVREMTATLQGEMYVCEFDSSLRDGIVYGCNDTDDSSSSLISGYFSKVCFVSQ